MHLTLGEIIFVVLVVVFIFSASRMATLGNALGKFVYSFKKASKGDGFIDAKSKPRIEDAEFKKKE